MLTFLLLFVSWLSAKIILTSAHINTELIVILPAELFISHDAACINAALKKTCIYGLCLGKLLYCRRADCSTRHNSLKLLFLATTFVSFCCLFMRTSFQSEGFFISLVAKLNCLKIVLWINVSSLCLVTPVSLYYLLVL